MKLLYFSLISIFIGLNFTNSALALNGISGVFDAEYKRGDFKAIIKECTVNNRDDTFEYILNP